MEEISQKNLIKVKKKTLLNLTLVVKKSGKIGCLQKKMGDENIEAYTCLEVDHFFLIIYIRFKFFRDISFPSLRSSIFSS